MPTDRSALQTDKPASRMPTDESAPGTTAERLPATERRARRPTPVRGARRSRLGAGVGMVGAALVAIGTFLPWLELNGHLRSGWGVFRLTGVLGTNPAVISPMFGGGASDVFFTGVVTLFLGILSLLLIAALLITGRAETRRDVGPGMALAVATTLVIATALVVTTVNLRTARLGTQGFDQMVRYGLWVTFAGGWAGTLAMAVSISGRRRLPQPQSQPLVESARLGESGALAESTSQGAPSPDELPEQPASGPSGSAGHGVVWAAVILMLLVGLVGFVVAAAADQSAQKNSVANEAALGQRDPVVAATTLRTGFASVNAAFNAYAAASQVVATTRQDVADQLAKASALSKQADSGAATADPALSSAIAAHGVAVQRERAARQVYVDRLTVLVKEVHQ